MHGILICNILKEELNTNERVKYYYMYYYYYYVVLSESTVYNLIIIIVHTWHRHMQYIVTLFIV